MRSLFLRVASAYLLPGLVIFSGWILLRGHDVPGGGFIAGLTAAAGFALRTFACGSEVARAELRVSPRWLIGVGLLIALIAGSIGLVIGQSFLEAYWLPELPLVPKLGTPVLFDLGIYLLVLGATLSSIFALSEAEG